MDPEEKGKRRHMITTALHYLRWDIHATYTSESKCLLSRFVSTKQRTKKDRMMLLYWQRDGPLKSAAVELIKTGKIRMWIFLEIGNLVAVSEVCNFPSWRSEALPITTIDLACLGNLLSVSCLSGKRNQSRRRGKGGEADEEQEGEAERMRWEETCERE